MPSPLKFPENFLWGSATSSHQIEGNNHNNWSEWERSPARLNELKKRGEDPQNFISGSACDSWNRFEEDIKLLKELGQGSYRFSIEWSRIEPEEGKINHDAINHYRSLVKLLCDAGIEPVVTLWHFTSPIWFSEQGGWLNPKSPEKFLRFINPVVDNLKDLVKYWITFNEATTVYSQAAYGSGTWPPQERSLVKTLKVKKNFVRAHILAYRKIRQAYQDAQNPKNGTMSHNSILHNGGTPPDPATLRNDGLSNNVAVGFVENNNYFDANPFLKILGVPKFLDYFHNNYFLIRAFPYYDFIGLNYYNRKRILKRKNKDDVDEPDMGWDYYPQGIYHFLRGLKKFNRPIFITENGWPFVSNEFQSRFIRENLFWIHKAISEKINVRGYFYWSLLDNFEWAFGYKKRFGLVAVNFKTFERKIRPAALEYAKICRENQL